MSKYAEGSGRLFLFPTNRRSEFFLSILGNACSVGIRKLSTRKGIEDVLMLVSQPAGAPVQDNCMMNWNKRNREYLGKIRSGDLLEIGTIYRNLQHISTHKELSFGEKNLLHQTELLLAEEISIVNEVIPETATEQLRTLVQQAL